MKDNRRRRQCRCEGTLWNNNCSRTDVNTDTTGGFGCFISWPLHWRSSAVNEGQQLIVFLDAWAVARLFFCVQATMDISPEIATRQNNTIFIKRSFCRSLRARSFTWVTWMTLFFWHFWMSHQKESNQNASRSTLKQILHIFYVLAIYSKNQAIALARIRVNSPADLYAKCQTWRPGRYDSLWSAMKVHRAPVTLNYVCYVSIGVKPLFPVFLVNIKCFDWFIICESVMWLPG